MAMPPATGTTARASGERSRPAAGAVLRRRRRRHGASLAAGCSRLHGHRIGFCAAADREETARSWTCSSTRASSTSPASASPSVPGGVADTVDEAVEQADAGRLPGRRQGAGAGRRARQGRAASSWPTTPTRCARTPGTSSAWTSRATPSSGCGSSEASDIDEEYYASFTLDRAAKQHLLMLSAQGGVDIEEVAATDPDAIVKLHIDPVDGLSPDDGSAGRRRCGDPRAGRRRRRRRSSSSSTSASPRATATWPRSTR